MTEWISQDVLCQRLGITPLRFGFLLEDGALPRARWNGVATLWNWDEVRESNFVVSPSDYVVPYKHSGPCRIYFAEVHDFIKIGYADAVKKRVKYLQVGGPYDINILHSTPGGPIEEEYIHRIFAADRVRGEWFRKTPRLLALIKVLKAQDSETNEVQTKD